jgi:hypothetical protein
LELKSLRAWGNTVGLQLIDKEYRGAASIYEWRCKREGHVLRRTKGNIQQSIKKGYPACKDCSPGGTASSLVRKNQADEFALSLHPILEELKRTGSDSLDALAQQLNERNVPTARGARWYASTVKNMLDRVSRLRQGPKMATRQAR